jgi:hypothetical protein
MTAAVSLSQAPLLRRLGATLLAVIFLAAPAAFGAQLWQCRVMGTVHVTACCPAPAPSHTPQISPPTAVQEAACCAVLETEAPAPSVTRDSARADTGIAAFRAPQPAAVMVPAVAALVQLSQPPCAAHPPTGPPLYTQHCSYLL